MLDRTELLLLCTADPHILGKAGLLLQGRARLFLLGKEGLLLMGREVLLLLGKAGLLLSAKTFFNLLQIIQVPLLMHHLLLVFPPVHICLYPFSLWESLVLNDSF